MDAHKEIEQLATDFEQCRKVLIALGDENRQHMILEMMKMKDCYGVRVNDISKKTHLSRPAVSHHLQILKQAGILNMRKEGTKNYYSFHSDCGEIEALLQMLQQARVMMRQPPQPETEE